MKGTAKIYYKQSQYVREAHREILNFEPPNANISYYQHHIPPTSPAPPPPAAPSQVTVDVYPADNSNEIFVIPSSSSSSTSNGQPPLNF